MDILFDKIGTIQKEPIGGGGFSNARFVLREWLMFEPTTDDDSNTIISQDILLNDGFDFVKLYGTADKNAMAETSNDLRDHDGHERTFTMFVPGSSLDHRKFFNKYARSEMLFLVDEDATGITYMIGGANGMFASLKPAYDSGTAIMDEKGYTITLKADGFAFFPIYTGKGSFQKTVVMIKDQAILDVSRGNVFVTPTDNTAATAITTIENYVPGQQVTVVGRGGVNPTKILSSNSKFDLAEDWTGVEGAEIRIYIYDTDVFKELSRSVTPP